ncbi:MAG TPA: ATP-binding protein [Pseudobdellovibrionaceae bacterium]|nr:ATP-binding protein [Pseudobdellovibrionaceae bacterium]
MSMITMRTWVKQADAWKAIRLEMRWVPGLPQIVFLGGRDPALRDVALRVKSAIRSLGFRFPRGLKLLVDISPRAERISMCGLDLPVALGVLWLTEQVKGAEALGAEPWVWGDLSLGGEVKMPEVRDQSATELARQLVSEMGLLEDLGEADAEAKAVEASRRAKIWPSFILPEPMATDLQGLLSMGYEHEVAPGDSASSRFRCFGPARLSELADLTELLQKTQRLHDAHRSSSAVSSRQRSRELGHGDPQAQCSEAWAGLSLNRRAARFVIASALGRFHTLVLGPHSMGLASLLRLVHDLRSFAEFAESSAELRAERGTSAEGDEQSWPKLPLEAPTSPLTIAGLLGGGSSPRAGALARVRGGCLLLEEWERWNENVRLSLMAPMAQGSWEISRSTQRRRWKFESQILASGSLCACGQSDLSLSSACRCPSRLRSLREQTWRSPVMDHFVMLGLPSGLQLQPTDVVASSPSSGRHHDCLYSLAELRSLCVAGLQFRRKRIESEMGEGAEAKAMWRAKAEQQAQALILSQGRRAWAQERVARALADLDQCEEVGEEHRLEARLWTVLSFAELGRRELPSPWATLARTDLTSDGEAPTL